MVGAGRTAEELGRAFPGVAVRTSGGDGCSPTVAAGPALVVATPGAEPVAAGGYGAALLLDGWALLSRADLRAGEEALRRWVNAAALVRPDGTVVVGADAGRAGGAGAGPVGSGRLRAPASWPSGPSSGSRPAVRMAALTGPAAAVAELLSLAQLARPRRLSGS